MMVMGTMKKSSDDDSKRYGGADRIPQYADSGRVCKVEREEENGGRFKLQTLLAQLQICIIETGKFLLHV